MEGLSLGILEGLAERISEGLSEGRSVGLPLGILDGLSEGEMEGLPLGRLVGLLVGHFVLHLDFFVGRLLIGGRLVGLFFLGAGPPLPVAVIGLAVPFN